MARLLASFRGAMQTRTPRTKSTENFFFFLLWKLCHNEVMVSATVRGSFDTLRQNIKLYGKICRKFDFNVNKLIFKVITVVLSAIITSPQHIL